MQARPGPVTGKLDQPSPHGIEQDIAHRRGQMRLIHRHCAKASLPEVAGPLQPRVNSPGMGAMHAGERTRASARRTPSESAGTRIR